MTPTLVLHAFASSARTWREVNAPALRVLDLPGFGGAPALPNPSLDAYADWVLTQAPDGRWRLAGHSMGGKFATLIASRRPPGLAGLVLVAPSPPTEEPIPDRPAMGSSHGNPSAAARTAHQISARATDPAVLDLLVSDSVRSDASTWAWWIDHGSREDISAACGAITCPTLVVAGADDVTITPQLLRTELLPRLPGSRMITVQAARHMLPLDAPGPLAAAMLDAAGASP